MDNSSDKSLYRLQSTSPGNLPKIIGDYFVIDEGIKKVAMFDGYFFKNKQNRLINPSPKYWLEKVEADQDAVKKLVNIIVNSPDYPSMAANIENNYFLISKQ